MWGGPQKERGAVGRTLAVPSRSKDTGPYPEPLPMYGHSFVPVAACPSSTPNPLPVPQKKNSLFIVKNGICSFQVKLLLTS